MEVELVKRINIGLVVFPLNSDKYECGQFYINQFIRILSPLSDKVITITGNYRDANIPNNVSIYSVKAPMLSTSNEHILKKIYMFLLAQMTISLKLVEMRKDIDVVIFFFSNGSLILPPILAKLLGKKIIVATTGSFSESIKVLYRQDPFMIFYRIMKAIEYLNYELATIITVGSDKMIDELKINKYKNKTHSKKVTSSIDSSNFSIKRKFSQRDNIFGYVGRLSKEKGVIELCKAIPLIISKRNDVKFIIVGDGPLMGDAKRIIQENGCLDKVVFTGWIPNKLVPNYFNLMKFHILPSFTEALGGSNIEAISCGAISIVNNVGGLPDIVVDNETGFVLESNSPEIIAEKINTILEFPLDKLESIQKKGKFFVDNNFSYSSVLKEWQKVFAAISE